MADDKFKFKQSKEDLGEMKDLLREIQKDLEKNKDKVLEWTAAEKMVNEDLAKTVTFMKDSGISTQRTVTAINAMRAGTMDVATANQMLASQKEDMGAAEKAHTAAQVEAEKDLANFKYHEYGKVKDLEAALAEEKKNGWTDEFYNIQAQLAAKKKYNTEEEANIAATVAAAKHKVDSIEHEGMILEKMKGQSIAITESKEAQTNQDEIKNKLLGGHYDKLKEVGKQAKTSWGMAALGVGAVIGLVMALAAHTDQIGEKFGAVGVTDFKTDLMGATAEATKLGYGFDEVAGSVSELSNNFGIAFGDAIEISKASMDTARALGISTDQAAGLTGQLMIISGHSAESAQNFLKQTAALAKSAGVAPGVVMEDMAGSSEEIAMYTKGSGENIAQAAVKARSMGMALADVAKIADGLLDFGSSLEAEMTASVMIGRQLNLQKARELALAGELGPLQDEILTQVGSEADFLAMNVLQRKALADAIGVGVGEMSKMVSEAGKGTQELARMRELDLSEIASDEAISNITLFKNHISAIGIAMLAGLSSVTSFFDGFGEGWGIVGTVLTLLGIAILGIGLYLGATALSAYATGAGLSAAGAGATTAGGGLAVMATAGSAAIPLLLTIALVAATLGLAFFGIGYILKQMPPIITAVGTMLLGVFSKIPPIIDAVASGFKMVAESITGSILQLATPAVVMGIMGLAGAFWMLAGALLSVAAAGLIAAPGLAVVTGFTAAMTALAAVGGGGNEAEQQNQTEALKIELQEIKMGINKLVKGFGGDPGTDGEYITDFASKVPKKTQIDSGLI